MRVCECRSSVSGKCGSFEPIIWGKVCQVVVNLMTFVSGELRRGNKYPRVFTLISGHNRLYLDNYITNYRCSLLETGKNRYFDRHYLKFLAARRTNLHFENLVLGWSDSDNPRKELTFVRLQDLTTGILLPRSIQVVRQTDVVTRRVH